jgi:hypothetical protein
MWQEISVALIVVLSALYISWRYWKKFKASREATLDCAGGCESCKEKAGCPFDRQTVIRPNRAGIVQNRK